MWKQKVATQSMHSSTSIESRTLWGKRWVSCQWSPKIAQIISNFGPLFCSVFVTVSKHRLLTVPCCGGVMAKKYPLPYWRVVYEFDQPFGPYVEACNNFYKQVSRNQKAGRPLTSRMQCRTLTLALPQSPASHCWMPLTHYQLALHATFWSKPPSVASTRSVLKWLRNWNIYSVIIFASDA